TGAHPPTAVAAGPGHADFVFQNRHDSVVPPVRGGQHGFLGHVDYVVLAAEFTKQDAEKALAVDRDVVVAQPTVAVKTGPQTETIEVDGNRRHDRATRLSKRAELREILIQLAISHAQ